MNEDELKRLWKSSNGEKIVRLNKSRLILEVQSDADRWSSMLKYRYSKWAIMILVGWVIIFMMMVLTTPSILSKIGAILVISPVVFWFIRSRRVKELKPRSFSESYIDYLHKVREHAKAEKKLYDGVLWFIVPVTTGSILKVVGSFETVQELVLKILVYIAVGIILYFLSRRIAKKLYVPRLEKVERLIKMLTE